MKRITLLISIGLLLVTGHAYACLVTQPANESLFRIFNDLFYETGDPRRMGSDIELLNSGYFLPDGSDLYFGKSGDVLRIDLTYSAAGFTNELGYMAGDTYHTLAVPNKKVPIKRNGNPAAEQPTFTIPKDFMFADSVIVGGDLLQRWFADADSNPLGARDHFLAFAIDDPSLLDVYNQLFGTEYTDGLDQVWMIAFEDLNLGDADYNDLIAIVARPHALNPSPVPLPGAAVLLFSGVAGAIGIRKRRWGLLRREARVD